MVEECLDGRSLRVRITIVRNQTDQSTCFWERLSISRDITKLWCSLEKEGYRRLTAQITDTLYYMSAGELDDTWNADIHIPGPPNTRISSLELPPLSLIGMT